MVDRFSNGLSPQSLGVFSLQINVWESNVRVCACIFIFSVYNNTHQGI